MSLLLVAVLTSSSMILTDELYRSILVSGSALAVNCSVVKLRIHTVGDVQDQSVTY